MPETNQTLHWSAFEHEHVERGNDWFLALGVVAVCASLTSILFHDVLFAIVIILAAVTLGLIARTPPIEGQFEISDSGIRVDEKLHQYNEIISFWVEEESRDIHGRPLLLVDTTKFMTPNLIIPIEQVEPALVRAYLKERATETPMKEPISHKILEFFGF